MKNYLSIETIYPKLDRTEAIRIYKKIQESRLIEGQRIALFKREKLNPTMATYTHNLRGSYKDCFSSIYSQITKMEKGRLIESPSFPQYCINSLKDQRESFRSIIQKSRRDLKRYTQNVRVKPNYWMFRQLEDAYRDKRPQTTDKYIGIEIECLIPNNWKYEIELLPYRKYLSIASDGSINEDEMESEEDDNGNDIRWTGKEFRILAKESELFEIIEQVTKILNRNNAQINNSCGLHVHFDMRETTLEERQEVYGKLYHSLSLLKTIVPHNRLKNQYCRINTENVPAYDGERYKAINPAAYERHKTFEVRLFNGTTNAEKIINWVKLLQGIIKGKAVLRCPKSFDLAKRYWKLDREVLVWCKMRQSKFAPHETYGGGNVVLSEDTQLIRREGAISHV